MKPIEKIDPNFQPSKLAGHEDVIFYDCLEEPFQVYGLQMPENKEDGFLRLPAKTAASVNEGVAYLAGHTAGGRVRFQTDSAYVAIRAKLHSIGRMPHFALSGSAGFDLYVGASTEEVYTGTFMPPYDMEDGYESLLELGKGGVMREITIHFPLYSGVKSLQIGLQQGAKAAAPSPYPVQLPMVYYGSSITQGGCASRPGNAYPSMISRQLGCDHVNLGFSGSARGEAVMAEYIAGLTMSAFVYDYDHNAPSLQHLQDTHEKMFQTIRSAQPELPIIMVSRPKYRLTEEEIKRRDVIRTTYEKAAASGDSNVYFVDGSTFFSCFGGNSETVDGSHPNDLGFMYMAEGIGKVLHHILK